MSETISLNLGVHSFFSVLLGAFLVGHILLVALPDTSKFAYQKRLMFFLPAYYGVLASVIFTGILAFAFGHFAFSFAVVFMIIVAVLLIISGAKGNKRLKRLRIFRDFAPFKLFMYKKIAFELVLVVLAYYSARIF